jgi:hypothetical protein
MKPYPKRDRRYKDETLNFCLEDGEWLKEGSESDELATAILHETGTSADAPARAQILGTSRPRFPDILRRIGFH